MTRGSGRAVKPQYADRYYYVPDGLRLHYRDYPGSADKAPLLCLPGLTRNARDFANFAERYSSRFRVLLPEFRGRGGSDYDPIPSRYLPPTYASDIIEFLDQLAISRAIFVGTSLGGLVTMIVAGKAPQRIAGAILNDVGPELSRQGLDRIRSYVGKDVRFKDWDEVARALAANHANFADYKHSDWLAMARRTAREENGELRFDYDIAIAQPFRVAGPTPRLDMWPLFMALAQKPLLVLRGEDSDLLSAEAAEKMRRAAPNVNCATVPRVGHPPTLDEAEAVAAIDSFLEEVTD